MRDYQGKWMMFLLELRSICLSIMVLMKVNFLRTLLNIQASCEASKKSSKIASQKNIENISYPLVIASNSVKRSLADLLFFIFFPSIEGVFVDIDAKHAVRGAICCADESLLSRQQLQRTPYCCAATSSNDNHFLLNL